MKVTKTKINTIIKLCKKNEKYRPILSGFKRYNDNQMVICDLMKIFIFNNLEVGLKEVINYEPAKNRDKYIVGEYINIDKLLPQDTQYLNRKIDWDINKFMDFYKANKKYGKDDNHKVYVLKQEDIYIPMDMWFIKEAIDILGRNIILYGTGLSYSPVMIMNNDDELGMLLPIRIDNIKKEVYENNNIREEV